MCTVTFVNINGKTIITSNRDENVSREIAIEPRSYSINNKNIIFPKDPKAGGTWFAVKEDGLVLVLLNGAAEKHQLKSNYSKSRGLVVLDLISSDVPIQEWNLIDLSEIEPFTIVLFQNGKLYQLRWNEIEKETIELDVSKNYIWSSSTLYSHEIRDKRANWFRTFFDTKLEISPDKMFNFHRYSEENNNEKGLVININDNLKTVSITQTVIEKNKTEIFYYDLLFDKKFSNKFITI